MNILTIAYTGEGTTDQRFLGNIILRTFEDVLIEANSFIDIYDPIFIKKIGDSNIDKMMDAARKAEGFHVLCIHVDADFETDKKAFEERINPAFDFIKASDEQICKNLVAIIPIQMTEAWMLADIETLLDEIGTDKSIEDLNLTIRVSQIEKIAHPKDTISNAIRIAFQDYPKRRKTLHIADLYTPLSQKIRMENLKQLSSYQKFREAVKTSLIKLSYLVN